MLPLSITVHFRDAISVKTLTTVDAYGNRVLSAAISTLGRQEFKTRRVTSVSGEELTSGHQVFMFDIPDLTPEGEITLPDGTTPRIRALNRFTWPNQSKHIELFL